MSAVQTPRPRAVSVGTWVYRLAAISNFIVTIPAFVAYDFYVGQFTDVAPRYPFLVWIWSGMAFLWGVMFWEISRDVVGRYPMIKYSYLEKAVTSTSVVVGYITQDLPTSFLAGVVFTDIIWIPLFVAVQVKVAALRR